MLNNLPSIHNLTSRDGHGGYVIPFTSDYFCSLTVQNSYLSCIHSRSIKSWRLHLQATSKLFATSGLIKVVTHFETEGTFSEYFLDAMKPQLLIIPPGNWFAFQNLADITSSMLNFSDLSFSPLESKVLPLDSFAYNWKR